MSIWKEIKYAINSTLGTSDFQPLDTLLRSTKTLSATKDTTNVIFAFQHKYDYSATAEYDVVEMKMLTPGNVHVEQVGLTGGAHYNALFNVYINGTKINDKVGNAYIYFKKGDIVKITSVANTSRQSFGVDIEIYADINDTSSIAYI